MEFTLSDFLATCETSNCENKSIAIEVKVLAEEPNVICGACGIKITQVTSAE